MLSSTQSRIEELLTTIDRLGMVKIKHLQAIHDLKSYRNACRVVKQLNSYVNETYHNKEKVIYLNKYGRDLIGSTKEDNKKHFMEHTFLRNDVYIHFNCPHDWKNEYPIEVENNPHSFGINFGNMSVINKRKLIADAAFRRNGYLHLIEVDNLRKMIDNKKKVDTYREMFPKLNDHTPILFIFTTTHDRRRKFEGLLQGIRHEVRVFGEIN
ncbi:hypothetical protein [Cytobacillus horneckiae]|uniref:hypothetical protein n=1 Tax=Cytobacillus horneckiae TaxID=549687 RepID=UPI0039A267D9